jgi:multiple sugar transport system substrate-binding protein
MLERAEVLGQYPPRPSLYDDPRMVDALPIPPGQALDIVRRARPRPVTPVYAELSGILQVWLHRALTRQRSAGEALSEAAAEMERLLERVELAPSSESATVP